MKLSLNQRWTKSLEKNQFTTSEDLDQRVNETYDGKGVRAKSHSWISSNRLILNELGFLRHGKKGIPVVSDVNDNWYSIQHSVDAKPGNIYSGSIDEKATGLINAVRQGWRGNQELALSKDSLLVAVYNSGNPITLEDALDIQRSNKPVYEGSTQEFVKGRISKKPNPIHAKTKTEDNKTENVEIVGNIVISSDDYSELTKYFQEKGYNTSVLKQAIAKSDKTLSHGYKVEPTSEKPPQIHNYRAPRVMTDEVKKQLLLQEGIQEGEDQHLRSIKGLDYVLGSVLKDAEFKTNPVKTTVTGLEMIKVDPAYWKSQAWIASTTNPHEFYIILDHPNMGIHEIAQQDGKAVKFTPPRPVSEGLYWWPHEALKPEEVTKPNWWRLGVGNKIEIDGYVAVPEQELKLTEYGFDGGKVNGILGMNPHTWRAMLVKQAANELVGEFRMKGVNPISAGIEDIYVIDKAGDFYNKNPLLETVSGGETPFANSVLKAVRDHYRIPQIQMLGTK